MKKSKDYAPYLYSFLITIIAGGTQNLFLKSGFLFRGIVYFSVIVGMWRLIEWLLTRSENKWVQWGYVLLGINIYNVAYLSLDYYFFHLITTFSGFGPWDLVMSLLLIGVTATIFIESVKWSRAREKAQIENLTLQSENIEAKFKLLREQVNPEFLFQCLTTLQTMVRLDDPQTEGYILKLADVYRQALKKERNVVSLQEELAFLTSYMFLMRYGREAAISFEVQVSDASLDANLPVFALQLLGDNCIKHNVFSESHPLHIRIFQKDQQSITMTNNYQRNEIPKSYGIDMEHLVMRYALVGVEDAVFIEKAETTYSTTIKLF
jgi:two-component system, LytTR family, sensor kinase